MNKEEIVANIKSFLNEKKELELNLLKNIIQIKITNMNQTFLIEFLKKLDEYEIFIGKVKFFQWKLYIDNTIDFQMFYKNCIGISFEQTRIHSLSLLNKTIKDERLKQSLQSELERREHVRSSRILSINEKISEMEKSINEKNVQLNIVLSRLSGDLTLSELKDIGDISSKMIDAIIKITEQHDELLIEKHSELILNEKLTFDKLLINEMKEKQIRIKDKINTLSNKNK